MKDPTLQDLIERAREGDAAAFQKLYRRFYYLVHGLVLARVPYREVDDVVQEVFSRVYEKLPGLRSSRAFSAWLRKVVRSCVTDHLRRRANAPWVDLPENLDSGGSPVADALGLLEVMRELPDDYQEILLLRFVEGLSGAEIAELAGMTPGSVRIKLHRGIEKLRAKLGKERE